MNQKNINKQELKHAKQRLNEQLIEQKINKRFSILSQKKVIAHPKLLQLSVITQGIKNKYTEAEKKFNQVVEIYNKNKKDEKNKLEYLKALRLLKIERANLRNEVRQINKLNNLPKGKVLVESDPKIAIRVKNINKIYATKGLIFEALHDANLDIVKGSFNVILGPSGSGKTTLLNMISGLDRATTGEVIVNGVNIQALTTKQIGQFRRHKIGFVFQSYNLLTSLNVSDNIEVGRSLQTDPNKRQKIDSLLEDMGMLHNRKKMTYELSGGQQQRVSIARALAKTPEILIGDEPTGALDQKTSAKVFEIFQRINREHKTTVIIVTHNPKVAELADKVIHVKNGLIASVIENKNPKNASKFEEI